MLPSVVGVVVFGLPASHVAPWVGMRKIPYVNLIVFVVFLVAQIKARNLDHRHAKQ